MAHLVPLKFFVKETKRKVEGCEKPKQLQIVKVEADRDETMMTMLERRCDNEAVHSAAEIMDVCCELLNAGKTIQEARAKKVLMLKANKTAADAADASWKAFEELLKSVA